MPTQKKQTSFESSEHVFVPAKNHLKGLAWAQSSMDRNHLLYFFSGRLKATKTTTFSNLPYSAFKTNTLLDTNPSGARVQYSKFRFRKTIVSLRAPKHFKVGRQHYSIGNRFGYFSSKNRETRFSPFTNLTGLAGVVKGVSCLQESSVHQPLTTVKTVQMLVSLKFKVKPLE